MSSVTADTADDVGCEVLRLWTIVLSVTDLTAVLTGLVFVVTKGTVECSELSQLVSLEFVLSFGDGGSLENM